MKKFLLKVKKIVHNAKDQNSSIKQILVAGGYGYGNVGDEAQCSKTLEILTLRYPNYLIKTLTPNPAYSSALHGGTNILASRVMFFNQGQKSNCFDFGSSMFRRTKFLFHFILIYWNAFLFRANLPTLFINSSKKEMLQELNNTSLLYFCGGGYLTGKTLSRLWDGILLCQLCHVFRVPVVMSGQTIGIWNGKFNRMLAAWGFKHVAAITVRDCEFSLKDLRKIGLSGENYFATYDDALFCAKSPEHLIKSEHYYTVNFHYWGMKKKEKNASINKLHHIISHVLNQTTADIVFVPMTPSDQLSFDDYIVRYPNHRICCFEYDYDFKKARRVIADSIMCITMKHHPIIFAVGEDVPVISLTFSDYYTHKNIGALRQYGQEKFSVNLENEQYLTGFCELFAEVIQHSSLIIKQIQQSKKELIAKKEIFLNIVDHILSK